MREDRAPCGHYLTTGRCTFKQRCWYHRPEPHSDEYNRLKTAHNENRDRNRGTRGKGKRNGKGQEGRPNDEQGHERERNHEGDHGSSPSEAEEAAEEPRWFDPILHQLDSALAAGPTMMLAAVASVVCIAPRSAEASLAGLAAVARRL